MANNEIARGFKTIAAYKKNTNGWSATGVECGASDGFKPLSIDLSPDVERLPDESFPGRSMQEADDVGAERHEGTIENYGKFEGTEGLVGSVLGTAETPSQLGSSAAYRHDYTINDLPSTIWTLAHTDGTTDGSGNLQVRDYSAMKCNTLQLVGNAGQRLHFNLGVMCRSLLTDDSGANTAATIANVTEYSPKEYIYLQNKTSPRRVWKIYLNLASGSDFAEGDRVYPSEMEINFNRNQGGEITAENAPFPDEATPDTYTEVTGRIQFAKWSSWQHWTWHQAGTEIKLKFVMEGTEVDGGYYNKFEIWIPLGKITNSARPVNTEGKIPAPVEFTAFKSLSAPTGFPAGANYLLPFIRFENARTAAAF